MAAAFSIIGVSLDQGALSQWARGEWSQQLLVLCEVQAIGLLYFNLASILWTSCFAFTLYRDLVPSSFGVGTGRTSLRTYESYYHALCWPVRARAHTRARIPLTRAVLPTRVPCLTLQVPA